MTWKEFKLLVDKRLEELGVSEETAIWYIDISHPDAERFEVETCVEVDKKLGLSIC